MAFKVSGSTARKIQKVRRKEAAKPAPKNPFAGVTASGTTAKPVGGRAGGTAQARTKPTGGGRKQANRTIRRIRADQQRQAARNLRDLPEREKSSTLADLKDIAERALDVSGDVAETYMRSRGVPEKAAKAVRREVESDPVGAATLALPGGALARGALTAGRVVKGAKVAQKVAKPASKGTVRKAVADDAGRVVKAAKRKAKRAATAPKRAAEGVKQTPRRAKQLKTKDGRRQARRDTGSKLKQQARKRPVMTALGASAGLGAAGIEGPGKVNKRSEALIAGHAEALRDDPLKTLGTTARALPGAIAGVGQLAAAPFISGGRAVSTAANKADVPLARGYTGKEIAAPVTTTAKEMAGGLAKMASDLGSGDKERVKKSVTDDVGLALLIPGTQAFRRFRRSSTYKNRRGRARDLVAGRREAGRAKRAEVRAAKEPRARKPEKRQPVRDTKDGGEYVLRRTGRAIENRRARIRVSRDAERFASQGKHEGKGEASPVVKAAEKLERKHRGMSDAAATAAYYGLNPRSPKFGEQITRAERSIKPDDRSGSLPDDFFGDLAALKLLRENPKAAKSKEFEAVVNAYKEQAVRTETSTRAKLFGPAAVHGVDLPEVRMEAGVKVGGNTLKAKPISPDLMRRKKAELKNLRDERRRVDRDAQNMQPGTPGHSAAMREVVDLDAEIGGRIKELQTHGAVSRQAVKDFEREANEAIREADLATPAYVKDVDRSPSRPAVSHVADFPAGKVRKQHQREGTARARGSVDRSFATLMRESVVEPRVRRSQHRFVDDFIENAAIPVKAGKGEQRILTTEEIGRAVNRGDLDPEQNVVIHSQHFQQAALDPHREGARGIGHEALREALDSPTLDGQIRAFQRGDMEGEIRDRAADKGRKYAVVPREAAKEFLHQITPAPIPKGFREHVSSARSWNNAFSRAVLGYSPSWALAQVAAEGIPAAAAAASLNPAHWARVIKANKELKKMDPADRAAIDGLVGESLGTLGVPQVRPFDPTMTLRAMDVMKRNRVGKGLMAVAKGRAFHGFDRWKGGKFRRFVTLSKTDKELNGFLRGVGGTMILSEKIAKQLEGRPLSEQMTYLARNPKAARQLETYLDDVMGNWRAMTRYEAKYAPFIAFYPFVRYSLRWTFNAFPRQHPVRAQILYFMAQQNAEQLEQLLGAKPTDFTQYAFPVMHLGEDDTKVMPGGRRLAPGANALIEAIGRSNVDSILNLSPQLALAAQIGTGKHLFFGEDQTGKYSDNEWLNRGFIGLHQLLSYATPSRAANVPNTALDALGVKDGSVKDPGLGKGAGSEKSIRSNAFPYLPQDDEEYKRENELSRAFQQVEKKPSFTDYGKAGNDAKKLRELDERDREAAEGQAVLDRVLGGFSAAEEREFSAGTERYNDRPSSTRKSSGSKSSGSSDGPYSGLLGSGSSGSSSGSSSGGGRKPYSGLLGR